MHSIDDATKPVNRAVLFDMDGVVVDTEPVHELSRRIVYAKHGIPLDIALSVPVIGRNTDAIFADINRKYPFPVPLEMAIQQKRDEFVKSLGDCIELLPGVKELLKWARDNGFKTALVTASARQNVTAVIDKTGLGKAFDTIIAAEDTTKWKPDPEGYMLAALRLECTPENCVVIEDSPIGIEAALAAGMFTIGVKTGQGGKAPKKAHLLIENLLDDANTAKQFILEKLDAD